MIHRYCGGIKETSLKWLSTQNLWSTILLFIWHHLVSCNSVMSHKILTCCICYKSAFSILNWISLFFILVNPSISFPDTKQYCKKIVYSYLYLYEKYKKVSTWTPFSVSLNLNSWCWMQRIKCLRIKPLGKVRQKNM